MTQTRRSALALVLVLLAARAIACGGNGTCGGQPLVGGLPQSEERLGAADLQITDNGLSWLSMNARALIDMFVPSGLSFNIPESSQAFGTVIVCPVSVNPAGCPFRVVLNEARLVRSPPQTVTATLFLDIPKQDIPMQIFGGDCRVSVEATRTPVVLDFAFSTDPLTRALDVTPTARLPSGDALDITGTGACAAVPIFRTFLLGMMQTELQKTLTSNLEDRLCDPCNQGCPSQSPCGARGKCRHPGGRCVVGRQGLASQLDLAPLLGSIATERFMQVRFGYALGGRTHVDSRVLNIGLMGGAGQIETARCVPAVNERTRANVAAVVLPANAPDGQPYHVGVTLAKDTIEDLLASAWRAGALCLLATSEIVPQLTSDAFTLVLPALAKLLDGKSRRVLLGVRLGAEPRVKLGLGTSHIDDRGQRVLDDPLVSVVLPQLTLDLHTLVEDRYVRIGLVRQDVTLPLGVDFSGDGRFLTLLVGDASRSVTNTEVVDAEILGGSASSLAGAVPALISLALPMALSGLRPIEIPTFNGFGIIPRGAGGQPATNPTHAVLYADLKTAPNSIPTDGGGAGSPLRAAARTQARVISVRPGRVELLLGGRGTRESDPLEWSFRIGGSGPWSPYSPSRRLVLDDARLWLLGEHVIEVRARVEGRPETLDPVGASLRVKIEPLRDGTDPAASRTGGCTSAAGGSAETALLLIALWIASAARRRRRDRRCSAASARHK